MTGRDRREEWARTDKLIADAERESYRAARRFLARRVLLTVAAVALMALAYALLYTAVYRTLPPLQ